MDEISCEALLLQADHSLSSCPRQEVLSASAGGPESCEWEEKLLAREVPADLLGPWRAKLSERSVRRPPSCPS